MTSIILCGGSGTRLWLISRTLIPKQFVKLFDGKSLFQLIAEKNSKVCDSLFIVSNEKQYFLALDQLEELDITNNRYLLELLGRNTAPAIALAYMALQYNELVLVASSDHLIKDETEYEKMLEQAKKLALDNNLVTFGIKPIFAKTGFGYIEADDFNVKAFYEKPDTDTAQKYVDSGNYYWNSGMFMFKAGIFLEELQKYSLKIYETCIETLHMNNTSKLMQIKPENMLNLPEDSIDYAAMKTSKKVKVVPSNIMWSDIGSFDTLFEELPKDENNNTKNEKHIFINSKNNLIYSDDKYVATIYIEDLIIVDTGDTLLVSKRGGSQKVKNVASELKKITDLHNFTLQVTDRGEHILF